MNKLRDIWHGINNNPRTSNYIDWNEWEKIEQAIEAYIAEREKALTQDLMNKAIYFTANNDAGYFINSGLADVFDKKLDELELKSNER